MQSVIDFLRWLEATPLAIYVSQTPASFPAIEMIHLLAITIVFGMILVVDLRLIGLASRHCAVTHLCRTALPWTWGAFAIAAITGALMFTTQAEKYFTNHAFRMKFLLMALAGLNMLVFQFIIYRGVANWDRDAAVPLAGRLSGAISLAAWTAVVAYARWTAYYML